MQGHALISLDDSQIGRILSAPGLSVVLLTSRWDGNGVILRTIMDRLAASHPGVGFCVADTEDSPQLARLFNLTRPPGILFVKEGELVGRVDGPASAGELRDYINKYA